MYGTRLQSIEIAEKSSPQKMTSHESNQQETEPSKKPSSGELVPQERSPCETISQGIESSEETSSLDTTPQESTQQETESPKNLCSSESVSQETSPERVEIAEMSGVSKPTPYEPDSPSIVSAQVPRSCNGEAVPQLTSQLCTPGPQGQLVRNTDDSVDDTPAPCAYAKLRDARMECSKVYTAAQARNGLLPSKISILHFLIDDAKGQGFGALPGEKRWDWQNPQENELLERASKIVLTEECKESSSASERETTPDSSISVCSYYLEIYLIHLICTIE